MDWSPCCAAFDNAARPFTWQGKNVGAENSMICGSGKAEFRVDLPPGDYRVSLAAPSLLATTPLIGQVNPGPARVTFQDGKSYDLPQPALDKVSRLEVVTTVGEQGLALTIEPARDAKNWRLAVMDVRRK